MRRTTLIAVLVFIYAAMIAHAQQARDHDPLWVAPTADAAKTNPLTVRPEAIAGGEKIYRQRCATCHGDDGHGTPKAPDLTAPDVLGQSDGALFWKITSGNTHAGMPTFSFLPKPQRWQLVLYVRSLTVRQQQ